MKAVAVAPTFPTGPKLELDDLLAQLILRAQDVIATQGRLRALLRANQSIVGNVDLPTLLRRIVEAACALTGARYGALGVNDAYGGLEQFVHIGMADETVAELGAPPQGRGLLGALIVDPHPIRLTVMSEDARSAGFPPGHPPMTAFLGVPIRVRDKAFGTLYMTDPERGEFAAEDEELMLALAGTAGVAIENAWLHEEDRRRQGWLEASTEVTQALLSEDGEEPLLLIARQARVTADADVITVALPKGDGVHLVVEVTSGDGAERLTALTLSIDGSVAGSAYRTGQPLLIADAESDPRAGLHVPEAPGVGPMMVLPLVGLTRVRGALTIARVAGRRPFTEADVEMAMTFANHAAIALELSDARHDQQRILLLEDRDRIARDLHDHVIQRLFALGLTVQSVSATLGSDERAARLQRVVSDIDETIRQARTTIFQLRGPLSPGSGAVRSRLLAVVGDAAALLGFAPQVRFDGPFDAIVPDDLEDDLLAVLRESLTNCARHAKATTVEVELSVSADRVSIHIVDNGTGLGDTQRRSGLRNLRERAEQRGGSLTIAAGPGTALRWSVPLPLRTTKA
ncbi:MAG: hypothetical protein JWN20_1888 [Jatrophihabitantaceae bacterium]|nr:hypothetical protein [Jatrophihabitantaceae bacterium]